MSFALSLWLLLVAPAIGSFLAALADRLEHGEHWIAPNSRCRSCGGGLSARDMVPLLSYPLLEGACRTCRAPVPAWIWLAELAALALTCVVLAKGVTGLSALAACGVLWSLLGLALCDWRAWRLPDALTLSLGGWAIAWIALDPFRTLGAAVLTGAGAAAIFWGLNAAYRALRGRDGLGGGDVKMAAGLGVLCGAVALPMVILLAALLGVAWGAVQGLGRGHLPQGTQAVPFGICLSVAAILFFTAAPVVG